MGTCGMVVEDATEALLVEAEGQKGPPEAMRPRLIVGGSRHERRQARRHSPSFFRIVQDPICISRAPRSANPSPKVRKSNVLRTISLGEEAIDTEISRIVVTRRTTDSNPIEINDPSRRRNAVKRTEAGCKPCHR